MPPVLVNDNLPIFAKSDRRSGNSLDGMNTGVNYYWSLKNPDPLMPVWAKRRMEPCIKKFRADIERAAQGAYESTSTQSTLDWSDQRLDFRINMVEQGIKMLMTDSDEYYKERNRRRSAENGLPSR